MVAEEEEMNPKALRHPLNPSPIQNSAGTLQYLGAVSMGSLQVKQAVLAQENTNSISCCCVLNPYQVGRGLRVGRALALT